MLKSLPCWESLGHGLLDYLDNNALGSIGKVAKSKRGSIDFIPLKG